MVPALHYRSTIGHQVQCQLCPHECKLMPGEHGRCSTRVNRGGRLYSLSYGVLSGIASDPIEKKPLYHFYPGSGILSIGSLGCNMSCDFCQNCDISQISSERFESFPRRDASDMVEKAVITPGNIGIAYTYNEPTVFFEYMLDCAVLAKEKNLKNVMVSNGFINRKPLEELLPYMDAFNIDLKSFRQEFYRKRSAASLQPVLDTIARLAVSPSHLELTFLLIPGQNDNPEEWKDMIEWISRECGPETVLHVSRFFPRHMLRTSSTPTELMEDFMALAREKLHYVYPGNNPDLDNDTYCPNCGTKLIGRKHYKSMPTDQLKENKCGNCNQQIPGEFEKLRK